MKKFLYLGIILQIFLSFFIFLSVNEKIDYDNFLYNDKDEFILLDTKKTNFNLKNDISTLEKLADDNKVEIYKYVFENDKEVTIYTDVIYKNKLHFFKSSKNHPSKKSTRDFAWNSKSKVEIKSFATSSEAGIGGRYFLSYKLASDRDNFLNQVREKIGNVEYKDGSSSYRYSILTDIFSNYMLIIVWLLFLIINLAVFIQYLFSASENFSILKTFGWKSYEIYFTNFSKLIFVSLTSILVGYLSVFIYTFIKYGWFYLTQTYIIFVALPLFLLLVIYTCIFFFALYLGRNSYVSSIKGQNLSNLGIILNILSRIAVGLAIVFLAINIINLSSKIKKEGIINKSNIWQRAENVYAIELRTIPNVSMNTEKYRPYEKRLKEFYLQAERDKGLFMINFDNYQKLLNGRKVYEMNTHSLDEQIYSYMGKSIQVNRNYLKYQNPIYKVNEEKVSDEDFVVADDTLNILVPKEYKKYEKNIRKSYLEGFKFNKYLFKDVTKEVEKSLKVNLIYVKDKQNYFTYNPVEASDTYLINNPIVMVDTGNLDVTYYGAMLSTSTFVQSENLTGYKYILDDVIKTNTQSMIQSTVAIYDFKAEELANNKYLLATLKFLLIILLVILMANIYFSNKLLIEKYKYKMYIKKVFGFTYGELITPFVISQLLINTILASGMLFINRSAISNLIIFIWLIFDLVASLVIFYGLKGKVNDISLVERGS